MAELSRERNSIKQIAVLFEVSKRTVQRALALRIAAGAAPNDWPHE